MRPLTLASLVFAAGLAALASCGGSTVAGGPRTEAGAGGTAGHPDGQGGGGAGPGGGGGVAAGGEGGTAIEACDLHVPERLTVGPAPAELAPRADLVLANAGGEACALEAVALEGCGGDFTVALPEDGTVPGGGTLAIPVTLAIEGAPVVTCALHVAAAGVEHVVALTGRRDPDCLEVGPPALRFAPLPVHCGLEAEPLRVENRCGLELTLSAATATSDAFAVRAGAVPLPLPPGADEWLVVEWWPEVAGPNEGELRLTFAPEGIEPVTLALSGVAAPTPRVTDRFEVPPRQTADFLFVIDDGVAMAPFRTRLDAELRPFLSYLQSAENDYHLAVTTTGLAAEPGAGCPGGAEGGADGRFFPVDGATPRVITPDTPGLEGAWAAAIAVGTCRTGPSTPLEAALRALTPPLSDHADDPRHPEANDGNQGFLREEARLSIVFVTARADASPGGPNEYLDALRELKGHRNPHLLDLHAIAGDPGTGCVSGGAAAEGGGRLIGLVEQTGRGVFESICDRGWETALREITGAVFGHPPRFILRHVPVDADGDGAVNEADLAVRLDGREQPPVGPSGQRLWTYSATANAVSFYSHAFPEPDTLVEVEYTRACP